MMNMPLFLAVLMLASAQVSHAQVQDTNDSLNKHRINCEVVIGHGLIPIDQMFAGFKTHYHNEEQTGAIFLSCKANATPRIAIGASVVYEYESGTWEVGNHYVYGSFTRRCVTLAPEVTIRSGSFAHGKLEYYSLVGVGYTSRQQETLWINNANTGVHPLDYFHARDNVPNPSDGHLNVQISPLGLRFGKALGGFLELGIGYKGLINYGMTYRF